jgi:hypothetical protein
MLKVPLESAVTNWPVLTALIVPPPGANANSYCVAFAAALSAKTSGRPAEEVKYLFVDISRIVNLPVGLAAEAVQMAAPEGLGRVDRK